MNKDMFKLSKEELKYIGNLTISALLLNLVVEFFNQGSLVEEFQAIIHSPLVFLYNSMILLFTLSFCLLFHHRSVIRFFVSALWIACGVTNMILLSYRTTPFTAVDLKLVSDAIPLLHTYLSVFEMILIVIAIILLIFALIYAYRKLPQYNGRFHYLRNGVVILIFLGITLGFTKLGTSTNVLAVNFGNIGMAYKDYGFAYCFSNSLINTGISKPDNYSEETIQTIVDTANDENTKITSTPEASATKSSTPNIIFLQLESFFDPTHIKDFTFSEDPCPNFRSLKENYNSGFLSVPSLGAGTANTEFEIISGMNLDFFGPGEYPYKTILKRTTSESMAYDLKELGYSTHAIHNNTATFYGRHKVFPNLGFDTFTPVEYMQDVERNPLGWAKDEVLIQQIMDALTSTSSTDYIYTISVQGHGKYPKDASSLYEANTSDDTADSSEGNASSNVSIDTTTLANTISIDGVDEDRKFAFEYYASQIKEMDIFIGDLIKELEAYDEDVILVMYGDHLPSLNIQPEDLDNGDLYQTEYVIWNSKGVIDTVTHKDIQAYQLSAYTLQLLGQNPGLLTKLHQKELTAEANGKPFEDPLADSDGSTEVTVTPTPTPTPTPPKESSKPSNSSNASSSSSAAAQEDGAYLEELKLLQYDILYGNQDCYGGTNPFFPTELQYGVIPITINGATTLEDGITVTGQMFTPYSHIEINGELIETILEDNNTLKGIDCSIKSGDTLCVVQLNSDEKELSRSGEYIVP